jgi:hypothetical protein
MNHNVDVLGICYMLYQFSGIGDAPLSGHGSLVLQWAEARAVMVNGPPRGVSERLLAWRRAAVNKAPSSSAAHASPPEPDRRCTSSPRLNQSIIFSEHFLRPLAAVHSALSRTALASGRASWVRHRWQSRPRSLFPVCSPRADMRWEC